MVVPERAENGLIPIEFFIKGTRHGNSAKTSYEILVNPEHWQLCGSKRRTFTVGPDEKRSFKMHLYPMRIGYVPVPEIRICGLHESHVINHANSKQIHVSPPICFKSSLEKPGAGLLYKY
jgi:hypothetical protein